MTVNKSGLAILLSQLESFDEPSQAAEQYITDSEVAAEMLWQAKMQGDIEKKRIADLGCGTGILGLGAALLGAQSVIGVETDEAALSLAENNKFLMQDLADAVLNIQFIEKDVKDFSTKVDTVIQNPPFGTSRKHADRDFLEKACSIAEVVWTFHKESTSKFVESFASDAGFKVTHHFPIEFPLKRTMKHHKRKIHRIKVGCWRLEKK